MTQILPNPSLSKGPLILPVKLESVHPASRRLLAQHGYSPGGGDVCFGTTNMVTVVARQDDHGSKFIVVQ